MISGHLGCHIFNTHKIRRRDLFMGRGMTSFEFSNCVEKNEANILSGNKDVLHS